MSRPWLACVLILFCLPLFLGLRSRDLETDEAIYSFAVDRILEVGEWLQPKSSPSETAVFLEKPPLKFWIVAAPIRAGVLPHDEFGLRFWDALFGAVAFLYVFAIGSVLAGPICGAVAVLLLFVHSPLLLEHGLRTNNMDSPLFLCYCGGVYHFLGWVRANGPRRPLHAVAVGVFFVLGFMTKFVAALFLPALLGVAVLLFRSTRARLAADWRLWLRVSALVVALIAPWFIYAQVQFGSLVWETMFAAHVYERFTIGLEQAHIQPWNYYVVMIADGFTRSGVQWFVPAAGVLVLLVQTVWRRSLGGAVVLLWAALPLVSISLGSSKLYHYAYPFLPPLTIATGYLVALIVMLAPAPIRKMFERAEDSVGHYLPAVGDIARRAWARTSGAVVIWTAAGLILGAVLFGVVRIGIGDVQLFKSSGLVRPLVVIVLIGILTRRSALVTTLVVLLTVGWWTPVPAYTATIRQMRIEKHPLRDARDCLRQVERQAEGAGPVGIYADIDNSMWHPIYYYFRGLGPWTHQLIPSPEILDRNLHDQASWRPSLVQEGRYRDYLRGPEAGRFTNGPSPPMIAIRPSPVFDYVLLLPGPYSVCSSEAGLRAHQ